MSESNNKFKTYLQPAFLICVAVLVISSAGMSFTKKKFELFLKKTPLPLKQSLELLDENGLEGYKVLSKKRIENKETVKALGTEDYIQWVLEDINTPEDSPGRTFLLFITYYQLPDVVPHVPEECYTGGGFQKTASESIIFEINNENLKRHVPATHLVFANSNPSYWQKLSEFPVLYFFRVNGEYANTRSEARAELSKNIFGPHSYFAKIELVFNQQGIAPNKEQAFSAGEKLVNTILPILEADFWPDWENTK